MEKKLTVDLAGEVVAITGGAGVLCSAMSKGLAACGAAVAILDLAEPPANQLAQEIRAAGGTALAVPCNVLEKESVQRAAERIASELGPTTALINGAGGNKPDASTSPERTFFDLPVPAVKWVFDLNFVGTLIPCQVFGRLMAEAGSGNIINVSSMNAFRPLTRIPAYSAAKSAVSNFTQWLAVHMNQNYSTAIRVNAIAPGFFLTEQNRFLLVDEKTGKLTPRGTTIVDHTPMRRFGDPEDLVGTVLWLLSESSKFVNGIVVPVDGGFSAFGGV